MLNSWGVKYATPLVHRAAAEGPWGANFIERRTYELRNIPFGRGSHPGYADVNSNDFVPPSVNRALNAELAGFFAIVLDAGEKTTAVHLYKHPAREDLHSANGSGGLVPLRRGGSHARLCLSRPARACGTVPRLG